MRVIYSDELRHDTCLTQDENDWVYNGFDACVTLEILNKLLGYLDPTTEAIYNQSRALQGPVLEMNMRGLRVDKAQRKHVLDGFRFEIKFITDQLNRIIGEALGLKINWSSPAQVKHLFYDVFQLKPVRKRNAHGLFMPTVNREALEKLSTYLVAEPFCLRLLLLRDLEKKRQFLETEIDPDGRIRTSINLAGTDTGRFSSKFSDMGTGTNLQNVDRSLRSVFIPDEGMAFVNYDLEQADSRNVGANCWQWFYESHGPEYAGAYLDACESADLHTTVCKLAWAEFEWTDDIKANRAIADRIFYRQDSYRQTAKKLGHGTNYYGQAPQMALQTKIDRNIVGVFQDKYFKAFPCIKSGHEYVKRMLRETSTLTTLHGRRRTFWGRANDEATVRKAIAFMGQSPTADEMNKGLLNLFRTQKFQLLIQVHDSILAQVPEDDLDKLVPLGASSLRVPITLAGGREFFVPVEAKVGWNWGDRNEKKDGSVDNELGLTKWKGSDYRRAPSARSLKALLM
jgi:DNA polymerase-1